MHASKHTLASSCLVNRLLQGADFQVIFASASEVSARVLTQRLLALKKTPAEPLKPRPSHQLAL